jgi:two-component system, LytTR family, response regulator LytT
VTVRALIVDDEAPARSELRYLLGQHPGVEVVGEAASAGEALRLAGAVGYDVVFLDVEMPGLTGIEAARLVREGPDAPAVVFVTAHQEYAVDAFAVEAFDYLLKPVDSSRLVRVIERLSRPGPRPPAAPVEKIPVVSAGRTVLVDYDAIHYVQADGDYSRVHTYDRSYLCTSSLRELEAALPGNFVRIHRSFVVNLAKVSAVRRAGPDRLRLALDDEARTELDVARRQSRQVRERLRL